MTDPTDLADILQSILVASCACLEDTLAGTPEMCFVSHNEPADDCCDYLAVWVERIRPSHGFAEGQYITGGKLWNKCCDLNFVADISIRLVRPCFPTLKDNPFDPFPGADEMMAASDSLLQDIRKLQCCVTGAWCDGTLIPSDGPCLEMGVGDVLPHGPKGGCAGWTWQIAIELDSCCR